MAFRGNSDFASVPVYNQKHTAPMHLNLDPDTIKLERIMLRDVRQIGNFGSGELEIKFMTKKDIAKIDALIAASYAASQLSQSRQKTVGRVWVDLPHIEITQQNQ